MTLLRNAGIQAPSATPIAPVLRLTAVTLLLRPTGEWYVRPLVLAIAAMMLLSPRLLRMPLLWGALAALLAIRIAADWPLADNHIYLFAYWALAVALSLTAHDPHSSLAASSRALVGVAFALAVLWKGVLAPDFLDGRFFRVTLLTDPRFTDATLLVGGLTREQLEGNRLALAALPEGAELVDAPRVEESAALRAFALTSTWAVLMLELVVAASMLLPATSVVRPIRHGSLLLFCAVSYAFAPVAGFGWLLLILGFAQCGAAERRWRVAYGLTFVLVLLYAEVPWAELMLRLRDA